MRLRLEEGTTKALTAQLQARNKDAETLQHQATAAQVRNGEPSTPLCHASLTMSWSHSHHHHWQSAYDDVLARLRQAQVRKQHTRSLMCVCMAAPCGWLLTWLPLAAAAAASTLLVIRLPLQERPNEPAAPSQLQPRLTLRWLRHMA